MTVIPVRHFLVPQLFRGAQRQAVGASSFVYPTTPAATLFVAQTGNDNNNGSVNAPFRTINKAASVVNPDDVVQVGNGIWSDVHTAFSSAPSIVEVARGGTAGHPVIFRAESYLGAKLDGLNGDGFGGANQGFNFRSGAAFVRIQGFDIYGMASTTGSCAGIDCFGGGANSVLTLNYIHHCGRICIAHGFGQNGIFIGGATITVERNIVADIGRLGPTEGCGSPGPYQTNDHGIYHSSGNGLLVRNNIFYAADHGWSIQFYPTARSNVRILNNTFMFGNQYQNRTHMVLDADLSDSEIANNIFYDVVVGNTLKVFASTRTFTNVLIRNNLTSSTVMLDNSDPGITLSGNLVSSNPLLTTPPTDATILAGSPAINAGVAESDVLEDFNGRTRPVGVAIDIGAYEYSTDITYFDTNFVTDVLDLAGGTVGPFHLHSYNATAQWSFSTDYADAGSTRSVKCVIPATGASDDAGAVCAWFGHNGLLGQPLDPTLDQDLFLRVKFVIGVGSLANVLADDQLKVHKSVYGLAGSNVNGWVMSEYHPNEVATKLFTEAERWGMNGTPFPWPAAVVEGQVYDVVYRFHRYTAEGAGTIRVWVDGTSVLDSPHWTYMGDPVGAGGSGLCLQMGAVYAQTTSGPVTVYLLSARATNFPIGAGTAS